MKEFEISYDPPQDFIPIEDGTIEYVPATEESIYKTMIQQVCIPSGMLMGELGKVGPYYKYVNFPKEE